MSQTLEEVQAARKAAIRAAADAGVAADLETHSSEDASHVQNEAPSVYTQPYHVAEPVAKAEKAEKAEPVVAVEAVEITPEAETDAEPVEDAEPAKKHTKKAADKN